MFLTIMVKLRWIMYPFAVLLIFLGVMALVIDVASWQGCLLIGLGALQVYLQGWYAREAQRVNPDDTLGV